MIAQGRVHSDTMRINVLNTQITSSGLSLCNGPITLTAANGFTLYVWNNNAASPQMLVTSAGTYYVNCTNSNGSVFVNLHQLLFIPIPFLFCCESSADSTLKSVRGIRLNMQWTNLDIVVICWSTGETAQQYIFHHFCGGLLVLLL